MAENPCKTCTRVKYPESCENKTCRYWQKWFIEMWDLLREQMRREKNGLDD